MFEIITRAVLRAPDGELLLLQRGPHNKNAQGLFEFPGGKLDQDEQPLDAMARELAEETGLTVPLQLVHSFVERTDDSRTFLVLVYAAECIASSTVNLSPEHESFKWVMLSDLHHLSLTSGTKYIVQHLLDEGKTEVEVHQEESIVEKKATKIEEVIIYTDGGSRGNPGPSASGYVIQTMDGETLEDGGEYLGITTNNQAEYQAVKLALEQVEKYHPKQITFRIDSLLVVNQMNGKYQIRNRDLWPIHARIKELATQYRQVTFIHVYREFNKLADAKVNEILDAQLKR